jgi:hypothetical protein
MGIATINRPNVAELTRTALSADQGSSSEDVSGEP